MQIPLLPTYALRPFREDDVSSLARHADNREIWRNLRDGFPHPYTEDAARAFIGRVAEQTGVFCIACDDEAVGGIGLHPRQDVERFTAELGYWLGEAHWGRGVMTAAVDAITGFGFETMKLHRVFALPYAWNEASAAVLGKAGYLLEGRLRAAAYKDGEIVDQWMYARVNPEIAAAPS